MASSTVQPVHKRYGNKASHSSQGRNLQRSSSIHPNPPELKSTVLCSVSVAPPAQVAMWLKEYILSQCPIPCYTQNQCHNRDWKSLSVLSSWWWPPDPATYSSLWNKNLLKQKSHIQIPDWAWTIRSYIFLKLDNVMIAIHLEESNHLPRCCLLVCTASNCVLCHWTWECSLSPSLSSHTSLGWQLLQSPVCLPNQSGAIVAD